VADVRDVWLLLEEKDVAGQLFLYQTHQKVLKVLRQADFLGAKYHVVVANPPYMGGKGMNGLLKTFLQDEYKNVKSDLFSAFMLRIPEMVHRDGFVGMMTPFNWMFLSSFEKLRNILLSKYTLTNLVRPEFHAFFDSAYVTICAFTLNLKANPSYKGAFIDLQEFYGVDLQPVKALEAIKSPDCGWFYRASAADFEKIPGMPIAYWASPQTVEVFSSSRTLLEIFSVNPGIRTGQDPDFLRFWHEVSDKDIQFNLENSSQMNIENRWFPLHKGGSFRKWYGNAEHVINLKDDGADIRNNSPDFRLRDKKFYFKPFVSWSRISSSKIAFRFFEKGILFSDAGPGIFANEESLKVTAVLNSKLGNHFLDIINPTMNYQKQDIEAVPYIHIEISHGLEKIYMFSRIDWDSYETSWDFTRLPLLEVEGEKWEVGSKEETLSTLHSPLSTSLRKAYTKLRAHWQNMTLEMQRLEEENNRIFIEAYGLQEELTPDVPLNEITLTCNPHYRYGVEECEVGSGKWEEMEARLLADTMRELVSYAVGCMFGRYSLDKPGLILANQGEGIEDYWRKVGSGKWEVGSEEEEKLSTLHSPLSTSQPLSTPHSPLSTFLPDDDNVIPMLDGNWFADDIAERFRKFLRVAFGEDHYEENLKFVEQGLNIKGKRNYSIRDYFLSEFYPDHIKRYKKRPIYWLFSSPKGTFNALIYMHRYRPDTVSIVLNDYLREFRTKLIAEKAHLEQVSISETVTAAAKTKALRDIEALNKAIQELDTYERDILYPLATEKLEIDLDDGVKVNYPKFGKALKPIPGLT
jgi:type II restriction/modification system DNA methylase subunit YeeA